ncbi:MAG: SET domain-containing protein-lysine N-methyltransferase [Patescibacteria group bacterium]
MLTKKLDALKIKKSKIEGKGVFANRNFKKGETVVKWDTSIVLNEEETKKLSKNEQRYIFPFRNKFLLQQSPARYVNHSCNPNTKVVNNSSDVAILDIKKGDEITSDYSLFFTPDEVMKCNCGSKNCKKILKYIKK